MSATFEDFIDLADARLQQAAVAITDGARVSAATYAAMSAVTRSLLTLSTRYGAAANGTPTAAWQPAFLGRLARAVRHFRHHAGSSATPATADELIDDAARFVTIAQDLLATHLTISDPPRPFARTSGGVELLDTPVREHLLRHAVELSARLAELTRTVVAFDDLRRERPNLADAYRSREKDLAAAARELAETAVQIPGLILARLELELTPAPALAAPVTYPQPHEDPVHAAAQIQTELERLATATYRAAHRLNTGEHPPVHAAGDLRAAAKNLAVAHVLAADLLTLLTPHLPLGPGSALSDGADQLRAAAAAWARLRDPWEQIASVPDSGPRSPLTVQVNSVTVRLGRLLYAEPAWTPRTGPGTPRALDALLAPDTLDAICVTISALPRTAAAIAANHARLVANGVLDLHSSNRARRPEGAARRFYPLQDAQRGELATRYQEAMLACKAAATSLVGLSRGYRAARAQALIKPHQRAAPPQPVQVRDQPHHKQQQQPDSGRPIAPKR
jgi:hypothetical protein